MEPNATWRAAHIDEVARFSDTPEWVPLRRELGVTGFGINAYVGREVGGELVEPHDETSPGSGRHEEIYLVLSGHALFLVDGQEVDAPEGTFVFVPPGVSRLATTLVDPTTVVVLGGRPGAALPVSSFEYWYVAEGPYQRGEYEEAYELASEGLKDYPEHPHLNYQLACYSALAGETDRAIEHLRIAARHERVRSWIADDNDLASVLDDPRVQQMLVG
jgi:mannose-6-phosphate isomerase-like protein (cupin superfamily)